MSLIDLKNVSVFGFKNFNPSLKEILFKKSLLPEKVPILKNVSLYLKSGDRLGILGLNGSGKTSLLRVINKNYPISTGSLKVNGKIISMISLGVGLNLKLTGRENIKIIFILNNNLQEYTLDLERKIIEFSELQEFIDSPISRYSSGMMSRLIISTNLFQSSDILLSDEVFATGDSHFIHKSYEKMLEKWNKTDISITVSHNLQDIKKLCNVCYFLHKGEVRNFGNVDKMIFEYEKLINSYDEKN